MGKFTRLYTNQVGKVFCITELVEQRPDIVMKIFRDCVILRAEHLLGENKMEYVVRNHTFRRLAEGERLPTYRALLVNPTGKRNIIKFEEERNN